MAPKATPSKQRLHQILEYRDGDLIRRVATASNVKVGDVAGCWGADGYRRVRVDGHLYLAHRLVWAMYYEGPGVLDIDHIDRVPSNNRIENLRLATNAFNHQNLGSAPRCDNQTSGVRGVSWDKVRGKWRADIRIDGKGLFLGRFVSLAEAEGAYMDARARLHPGFVASI